MSTLVVYYSLEGNTDYVAQRIADKTGADLLRLVPRKAYKTKGLGKFIWGGKSALMAEQPELEPYEVDFGRYGKVILGFPVWASTFAPPIRTFVTEHADELKQKQLSAFACQSGSGGPKALDKLRDCVGVDSFAKTAVFIDPKDKQSAETDAAIDEFVQA